MENNSFCQRVIEAASARPKGVAMMLIGPGGVELAFVSPSSLDKFRAVCERLGRQIPALRSRGPSAL